ncbi:MAG: DUF3080 family protein [Oceanobacter sp.]
MKLISINSFLPLQPARITAGFFAFLVLSPLYLTACSDNQQPGAEYLPRLLNVLDMEEAELTNQTGLIRPIPRVDRSLLKQALPEVRIDLLDMLSLGGCELAQTIGERNSSLGKLAQDSQRMRMESDFLRLAPACIEQLKNDQPELSNSLQMAYDSKYQHRMKIWWNGWIAGAEWQALTSASAKPLIFLDASNPTTETANQLSDASNEEPHQNLTLASLDLAIHQGENWLAGNLNYDSQQQEQALYQWLLGESIGRWQTSQSWLTHQLLLTNTALQTRREQRHPCPQGRKTQRAEHLSNVMLKFYIGELQPYMAQTDRFGQELLERLNRLAELDTPPPAFSEWLSQIRQSREDFISASKTHVETLSGILNECGMAPGR